MAFTSDTLNIAQNSATDSHTRVQREQGKRPLSGVITAVRQKAGRPIPACPVTTLITSIKNNIQASILTYISQPGRTTIVVCFPEVEAMTRAFPPAPIMEIGRLSTEPPFSKETRTSFLERSPMRSERFSREKEKSSTPAELAKNTKIWKTPLRLARLQKRLGTRRSRTN
jgi:hypothetical protein